jgi:hypothetical protein
MGAIINAYKILIAKHEMKIHSEDLGADGRILLTLISIKWDGRVWIELAQDSDRWFVKKDSALRTEANFLLFVVDKPETETSITLRLVHCGPTAWCVPVALMSSPDVLDNPSTTSFTYSFSP